MNSQRIAAGSGITSSSARGQGSEDKAGDTCVAGVITDFCIPPIEPEVNTADSTQQSLSGTSKRAKAA